MRRLILALLLGGVGCAQPGLPPGGPEDTAAPKVLRIRPDSNATNARVDGVRFEFDEVVSERPTGVPLLADLFLISPSWGENRVSWKRTEVTVAPRNGVQRGVTYTVRMLPGLSDLDGNSDSLGLSLVFSTGPTIATGHVRGVVFDWVTEKVGAKALIEAFPVPTPRDSVRYLAIADSMGRFDLAHVPAGKYLLRAIIDQNSNRLLDPRELHDTATIALGDSLRREMLAIVRDTLGPNIQTVTVVDSLTLKVLLDHLLAPGQPLTPQSFAVQAADSSLVPIASIVPSREFEREKAVADSLKAKATADSAKRAAAGARGDSTRRDSATTVRADSAVRALAPRSDSAKEAAAAPPPTRSRLIPVPRTRRTDAPRAVGTGPARDSLKPDTLPKPSIAPPINEVVIRLQSPLKAGTGYRVRTTDLRSYLGRVRSAQRSFTTPKAKPVDKDSTAADTTRGRGPVRLRPRGPDTLRRPRAPRDTLSRDTIATSFQPPWRGRRNER